MRFDILILPALKKPNVESSGLFCQQNWRSALDSVFKRDEYVPHLHEFERHVTKSPIRRIILILPFEQTI